MSDLLGSAEPKRLLRWLCLLQAGTILALIALCFHLYLSREDAMRRLGRRAAGTDVLAGAWVHDSQFDVTAPP